MNVMSSRPSTGQRLVRRTVLALGALSLSLSTAFAAATFEQPATDFAGRVMAQGTVLPGGEAKLTGRGFVPGQSVTLSRGGESLGDGPYQVDDKGNFEATVQIPANAVAARHPIVVQATGPVAATVFELKVSPDVPLSGQDKFATQSQKLVQGLYQSAYSAKSDRLFVTAAVGRPPVKESQLIKVNPQTLAIEARVTPAVAKGHDDGRVYAVYGVDVDDEAGTVWVTNTRDDSVAVYKQSDLSLVKQFDEGTAPHARDVVVVPGLNKAYASGPTGEFVAVFDTKKLEKIGDIKVASAIRGQDFGTMSLVLDAERQKIYTVALNTAEIAVIDAKTDTVEKVMPVPGANGGAGIAIDAKGQRAYVAAQGSDTVSVVDLASGKVLATTPVGAGTLNVAYDPVNHLVYAANRGAGTVTVLDADGKIVANLDGGTLPNHIAVDGKGNAFAVNKSRGADDAQGDRITRLTPKQ
ncbi:YncE family protein [Verticiella alkaliphila]|uniref:YncE family protein n=1 Tax=Verticiella alkaliphila TaxID=2779529 RepID=UPI001C0AF447|nr:YncE family protein [Verticiella sp. GG226]